MAVQTGVITSSGKLGNKVYYKRNGKDLVRSAANKATYRLSEHSKKSSYNFGTASKAASLVHKGLSPLTKHLSDIGLIYRLRSKMIAVVNSAPASSEGKRDILEGNFGLLKECKFNKHKDLSGLIYFSPLLEFNLPENKLIITVPPLTINRTFDAPPQAETAVLQLMSCSFDFAAGNGRFARPEDLLIRLDATTFSGGSLEIPLEDLDEKGLVIAMGIHYLDARNIFIQNRKWYAGNIMEAVFIRNGSIVTFQYPKEKNIPAREKKSENRISWQLNEEEEE